MRTVIECALGWLLGAGIVHLIKYLVHRKLRTVGARDEWEQAFMCGRAAGFREAHGLCPCVQCTTSHATAKGYCRRLLDKRPS